MRNRVHVRFDGEEIEAEAGEPVAAALLRRGHFAVARSPKFHRPRGPACFRAACDGCLARVNGVPNVMTCMTPAKDGMTIEAQNTLGSRETDLLRATDWFFPQGMNHHELFAGVPGVQQVMQALARRVAGLGKLPARPGDVHEARRREVDALVVGGGPAGMLAARALADRGRSVELLEDGLELGGSALATFDSHFEELTSSVAPRVNVRLRTTAAGIYGDDVLVVSAAESAAEVLRARTLVLATGAHDGVCAFEGNDVPGVMSARAGAWLLRRGVDLGGAVIVAVVDGGGPFGAAYAKKTGATLVDGAPTVVHGGTRVKSVSFGKRELRATALLVDAPRAPAYELAEQAGAKLVHEPRGYRVAEPKIREGVWAVGEVTGAPLDLAVLREHAAQIV